MKANGLDKAAKTGTPVTLPDDVVAKTREKYCDAYRMITGNTFA